MQAINIYLNFDGNTKEAMSFYAECLGADLSIQSYKDSGMPTEPGTENRTIHARLSKGDMVLMASDTMPSVPFTQGNNFFINIVPDDRAEQDRLYDALREGGSVIMELQDTFWGARFGMITDKFGIGWMFNLEKAAT